MDIDFSTFKKFCAREKAIIESDNDLKMGFILPEEQTYRRVELIRFCKRFGIDYITLSAEY